MFAGHHRLECGADGHLGFAKAHVAANQPIHRLRPLHIAFGIVDGFFLIEGFLVNKSRLKLALPRRVLRKPIALLRLAHGLDPQHFGGEILHGALGFFLRFIPTLAAQRVECRSRLARANVFADQMRLADGHIKFRRRVVGIRRGVFDDEAFVTVLRLTLARAGKRQHFHPEKTPDAVLHVHHEIAFLHFGEINIKRRSHRRTVSALESARALDFVAAKNFRITHHHPFAGWKQKTTTQRALRNLQRAAVFSKTILAPEFLQSLLFTLVIAQHHHRMILPPPAVKLRKKFAPLSLPHLRLHRAAIHRPKRLEAVNLQREGGAFIGQFVQFHARKIAVVHPREQRRPFHVKRIARRDFHHLFRRGLGDGIGIAEKQNGVVRQMIEQRGARVILKVTQQPHLAAGCKRGAVDFLTRNLAERIEVTQRFQFIAEELATYRPRRGKRKHIHNAAAQRNFPARGDLRFRLVSLCFEPFDEIQRIEPVAQPQHARAMSDFRRRQRALHQRRHRGGNDRRCFARERLQRLKPFADGVGVREFVFVRQHFPIGIKPRGRIHLHQAQPRFQILLECFLKLELGNHEHHRATGPRTEFGSQMRPTRRVHAGAGHSTARRHGLPQGVARRRGENLIEQFSSPTHPRDVPQATHANRLRSSATRSNFPK